MQPKQIYSDRLPPLSVNYYPWLVAYDHDSGDRIFYNIHDLLSCYRCRIPELVGKSIHAFFHGWVVLSNHTHTHWFLWNPTTARLFRLPRLLLKDVGGPDRPLQCCYLSSPPDVPRSILLLARRDKPNFVFCRLDRKRKRLRWIEMSYAKQLSSITGPHDDDETRTLSCLTCCNGEVYATSGGWIVKIHIVVQEKSVLISLLPFVNFPRLFHDTGRAVYSCIFFPKSSLELLVVFVDIVDLEKQKPVGVSLCKLNITSMVWVEKEDLEDTVLYVGDHCSHAFASEFGGYVHILHKRGKVVYSYNVKDKTISMSFMHCLLDLTPSYVQVWAMPEPEFRLQSDGKCKAISKPNGKCKAKKDELVVKEVVQGKIEANHVLNIPFHVLEMILEFCVGVEYLNFRATCKLCHLAAPLINRKVPQRGLRTYSLVSPWLVVFEKRKGIITFTDPMFGDKYFIRPSYPEIVSNSRLACSRYGWLLLVIGDSRMAFFNPFTSEIRELPAGRIVCNSFCFSAPPASPDCMVVGFSKLRVSFNFVAGEPIWHHLDLDIGVATPFFYKFPTICGQDVYALDNHGKVDVFREDYTWEAVVDQPSTSSCSEAEYFLTTCNQHLLLLMVGDFGESVEVFKLTEELEWEKMDGLGRYAIYICDASSASTCLCMAAKTPEMENKIFFSRFHSKNGKIMFYSLKTGRFHTFDGRNIGQETSLEDFYEHMYDHTWIEPTWCASF